MAALAVASEPTIFWDGSNAAEIIAQINVPRSLGKLVPASTHLNGPSGKALDDFYLKPLGLQRADVWLCDLLPESRVNPNQRVALNNHYTADVVNKHRLKHATIKDFDKQMLNSEVRRTEILAELEASKAETIILLGDEPINWFLRYYSDKKYSKLSQFGEDNQSYGRFHELKLNDKPYKVLPLCHPRQSARLGNSSVKWSQLHQEWVKTRL